jgi:hypothetical protein
MKGITLNSRKIEFLSYFLIWAFVFSVPYFREREFSSIHWLPLIREWVHLSGFAVIFVVNVYLLVPGLLFKKKYKEYIAATVLVIICIIGVDIGLLPGNPRPGFPLQGLPPDGISPDLPGQGPQWVVLRIADNFIIGILTAGFGTAFKVVAKWLSEEKLRKDAEKEQLKTNLALLKHQVSPHFFMNTLNNIHALIEMDTEKAQDAVERLSTLMRYLLYDSAQNTIELKKEIEFINSFISLMQLRHSDEVQVTVLIPDQIPDIKIPPMLFISLLENAFKHGVSYPKKSYIYFEIQIQENTLGCIIKNSKHKSVANQYDEYSGIGLENIKKSLNLLYEQDYKLDISDKENEFEVNLTIPV